MGERNQSNKEKKKPKKSATEKKKDNSIISQIVPSIKSPKK